MLSTADAGASVRWCAYSREDARGLRVPTSPGVHSTDGAWYLEGSDVSVGGPHVPLKLVLVLAVLSRLRRLLADFVDTGAPSPGGTTGPRLKSA